MYSNQIIAKLKQEKDELARIIQNTARVLKRAPEGTVQVKKHRKGVQFFYRNDPQNKTGTYMPVSEYGKAAMLVQKRYLSRLLEAAGKQEKLLEQFLEKYDPKALENVFLLEGETRQKFLNPVVLPDEQYASAWQQIPYEGKEFFEGTPEHYTQRQERVRSKSEVIIANELLRANIPYRYECPIMLGGQKVHPDFTILRMSDRKEVYWEHLGMLDDADYRNNALRKIREYEKHGIFPGNDLIITAETLKNPLNAAHVRSMIEYYILQVK